MARPSEKETTRRLLAMLRFFSQGNTTIKFADLARKFNITEQQAKKDVEKLSLCGFDQYDLLSILIEGDSVIVWRDTHVPDKPARFSQRESTAMLKALEAAGIGSENPLYNKIVETKAAQEFDADRISRIIKKGTPAGLKDIMQNVSQALVEHKLLKIEYASAKDATPQSRMVEPHSLFNDADVWYLEAWCRKAQDVRTFRIDRIKQAELQTEEFGYRELPVFTSAIRFDNTQEAQLAIYEKGILSEFTWPGIKVYQPDEAPFGMPQPNNFRTQAPVLLATIPYLSENWLPQQVAATLGEVELLAPYTLRQAVQTYARAIYC